MHETEKLRELVVGRGKVAKVELRGIDHLHETPHRDVREQVPLQRSQPRAHRRVISPTS